MRKSVLSLVLLSVIALLAIAAPASAQVGGVSVTCNTGASISNGVEVVVNMRSGFTYTATAIGINGFDPVLAVLDRNGSGLCTDDSVEAASYSANLPSSGYVPSSSLSSQVTFSNNQGGLADVSLVVGGYNGAHGQFVLIVEGMAVTSADGSGLLAGDPFSVLVDQNVINSGTNLSAYMISRTTELDPLIRVFDDADALVYECDDAGSATCVGQSSNLNGYYVSEEGGYQLPGYDLDSMLSLNLSQWRAGNAVNFLLTSYNQSSFGDYVAAFHMGI
jgi:hypothetical protein